jgi:hypothetical protein
MWALFSSERATHAELMHWLEWKVRGPNERKSIIKRTCVIFPPVVVTVGYSISLVHHHSYYATCSPSIAGLFFSLQPDP